MSAIADYSRETPLWDEGFLVAGIDEAGRGPLAGPVAAAAVILRPKMQNPGFKDSKQLSGKQREELYDLLLQEAFAHSVAMLPNSDIDKLNIREAALKAMVTALDNLSPQPHYALIDGNYFYHRKIPYETIIGGDAKCASIAAASIMAKVVRDRWMVEIADVQYPEYGFARHKGYGTKQHLTALKQYGPCPLHRLGFLQKILEKNNESLLPKY